MEFTEEALSQIAALRLHYHLKGRAEASRNLTAALRQAMRQITKGNGVAAPRPYPESAQPGRAWTHAGRYWVRYTTTNPPVILGVFHDAADLPGRL